MRLPPAWTERQIQLEPTIHFTIRPGALRVRIPISR